MACVCVAEIREMLETRLKYSSDEKFLKVGEKWLKGLDKFRETEFIKTKPLCELENLQDRLKGKKGLGFLGISSGQYVEMPLKKG
ncbi:MAG: hypothetical protein PUB96_08815 [Helicobacteraceae bacterium]|nr:hypothetical protein [Helicobacteraceae bacterium]